MDTAVASVESMQRTRLFAAMVELLDHVQGPLLLVVDDIQWCDQDTLEWIEYLLLNSERPSLAARQRLLIATLRSDEAVTGHPVQALKYALERRGLLHEIALHRFNETETGQLCELLAGKAPSDTELAHVFANTEGNPLFVEEMVRSQSQAAANSDAAAGGEIAPTALPPKIQAVVEGRLVRLSPAARAVADVAAVLGRVFTMGLLITVTGDDEDTVLQGLDELWQRQVIRDYGQSGLYQDDAYDFAHDKLRDVVYQTLSPMRRRQLHRRAAQALVESAAHAVDSVTGQIASHYERGGQLLPATKWHVQAATEANQLSAVQEALRHLDHALSLLPQVAGAATQEAKRLELSIQTARGPLLLATKGYAAVEAEEALTRAWTICQEVCDNERSFTVMWGLSRFYQVQPNFDKGMAIAQQMVAMAEEAAAPARQVEAYAALGTYHLHRGNLADALTYLDRSLALYDPAVHSQHAYSFGQDPKVVGLAYSAWTLFCLGRTAEADARVAECLAWADTLNHPYSQVIARAYATVQQQFLGNVDACLAWAESTRSVANEYGFRLWIATSDFLRGWATCQQALADPANVEQGLALMQAGAELYRATGAKLGACYFAALLAETLAQTGQTDGSHFMIQMALAQFAETTERWCEAELYRIQGVILQQFPAQVEAAHEAFAKAQEVAAAQGAQWWLDRLAIHRPPVPG